MQTLINPYIAGNPVGNTSTFVGRDDVLREVVRVLRSPRQNAITLYGQRRIGKTSMLQHMIAHLPQEGAYQTIYFDLQDKVTLSLDGILYDLAVRIADKLELPAPKSNTLTSNTFKKEFIPSVLNNLPKGSSLVLLLDEFDVLADPKSVKTGAVFFPYLRELPITAVVKCRERSIFSRAFPVTPDRKQNLPIEIQLSWQILSFFRIFFLIIRERFAIPVSL